MQRCPLNMSSWCCLSGLAVYLVLPLTLYPPVPAWWQGLNLKNCCCHFIHNFQSVKSCRLKTRCRGGSRKSHWSVCLWCLKGNLGIFHTRTSTYTHTHTSERAPTVFFFFNQMQLLTSNLESKNHSPRQIRADNTPAKSVTSTHTTHTCQVPNLEAPVVQKKAGSIQSALMAVFSTCGLIFFE